MVITCHSFLLSRQPGKALPYYLQLRRPGVFALIREHNLFADVQDQALRLVEFDQHIQSQHSELPLIDAPGSTVPARRDVSEMSWTDLGMSPPSTSETTSKHGAAISLLVDHTHSIPIPRVVAQLQDHRPFLFMYLDALFDKDPHLAFDYSDLQVDLYAEYDSNKLMEFLRASNYYSLERVSLDDSVIVALRG